MATSEGKGTYATELPDGNIIGSAFIPGNIINYSLLTLSPVGTLINEADVWNNAEIEKILPGPGHELSLLCKIGIQAYVVRLDSAGQIAWQTSVGSLNVANSLEELIRLPDNGFLAAVSWDTSFGPLIRLTRLTASGAMIWQKDLPGFPGSLRFKGISFDGTATFSLLAERDGSNEFWQGDLNGNWAELQTFPTINFFFPRLIGLADGSSLLFGHDGEQALLHYQKISPSGQIIWQFKYDRTTTYAGARLCRVSTCGASLTHPFPMRQRRAASRHPSETGASG